MYSTVYTYTLHSTVCSSFTKIGIYKKLENFKIVHPSIIVLFGMVKAYFIEALPCYTKRYGSGGEIMSKASFLQLKINNLT